MAVSEEDMKPIGQDLTTTVMFALCVGFIAMMTVGIVTF